MRIVYAENFLKAVKNLPNGIQTKLDASLSLLIENPFHPLLHTKPLSGNLAGFYSFRVTRDWRVVFVFQAKDIIQLIRVGNRKDIYR